MNPDQDITLNHFSFTVEDIDRTTLFFEEVFGFELINKGPRAREMIRAVTGLDNADIVVAFMRGPGFVIEFIEYIGEGRGKRLNMRPCDLGFSHLALNVSDIEKVRQAAARHGAFPVGLIGRVDRGPNQNKRIAYIQTWDGVTVEVMGN